MALAEKQTIPFRAATPGTVFKTRLKHRIRPVAREEDTLSKAFLRRVAELGDTVAQRKKRFGIWQEYSWNEVYDEVVNLALGLDKLGLKAGRHRLDHRRE